MVAGTTFDFKQYLANKRRLIEDRLAALLAQDDPHILWESMRYSVLSGGKRLRAILCLATAEGVGTAGAIEKALPCACSIELVHAMSLIHDDLPALDNDDLRRGRPTNHKVFGEAMALLAGDALLAMSTDVLISHTVGVEPAVVLQVAGELSRATGSGGMVGGQVADMEMTGAADDALTSEALESMHRRKTGALIRFSTWSGARLAGANEEQLLAFSRFGEILGLAFQIADDLLDVTGDIKVLGKTPGKDQAANKLTWVRVYGVEGSREKLRELRREADEVLKGITINDESVAALEKLLDYAINRAN